MRALSDIEFFSRYVEELPGESSGELAPRAVPGVSYSRVLPTPVAAPRLLAWSHSCGAELGMTAPSDAHDLAILAGNALARGMQPHAARYGGHQFGNWAGQLGDGRAIVLGECRNPAGELRELQLKGAGPTPYSRTADGRAVLRSSLREFLCSEAMHALGVPTTRALSLVATGETVVRDMFYDGRPQAEPGAIVCRVAPSFVRFGNFEIHAAYDELTQLRALADFVIRHHYPQHQPGRYADWFVEVCERTAVLMAHWMRVGFVHGVMNTDNMSILGLTIDYGPYGWLEGYDPEWTPNTTDAAGRRYCYGNQPQIGLWNLSRLAGALLPLMKDRAALQHGLERYRETYAASYRSMLAHKLGLDTLDREGDAAWVDELFALLGAVETDMTIFFRGLAAANGLALVQSALYEPALPQTLEARWSAWFERRRQRIAEDMQQAGEVSAERRIERMNAVNPCYVPRNYLAQQAIDAASQGDVTVLEELMQVLGNPYQKQVGREAYEARRPEWARHRPGCSALSCSS